MHGSSCFVISLYRPVTPQLPKKVKVRKFKVERAEHGFLSVFSSIFDFRFSIFDFLKVYSTSRRKPECQTAARSDTGTSKRFRKVRRRPPVLPSTANR